MSETSVPGSVASSANIRDKTFVVVAAPRDHWDGHTDTLHQITALGGQVLSEVTPSLDYLVVLHRWPKRRTSAERRATAFNAQGAAIRFLDRASFRDLLSPTAEMALALLRGGDAGLAEWRLRRTSESQVPLDLSGADLRGAKLTDIVLYRVKLDGADLSEADLSNSRLDPLVRVNLDGANLSCASVPQLTDCSMRNANLVRFNPTVIVRTDLSGANLTNVEGRSTRSEQANFRGADLTDARLDHSTFLLADFAEANLTRSGWNHCDLTGANFRGANLTQASLCKANLTNADLSAANLTGANLAGADLTGANLAGANFTGTRLYAANLSALGPGQPIGLVAPVPVAVERIGPNLRQLEAIPYLETSLHIDSDRRGTNFVQLHIQCSRTSVNAFSTIDNVTHSCQANTLGLAMIELAQLWPDAELYPETLRASTGSRRDTPKTLFELALAAWYEAFALPLPTLAERQARQQAERERFLALLRGGPDGVQQWNALRSETLTRAGHFRRASLANCDLRGANLGHHVGYRFGGLDFQGANFAGANLTGSQLSDCQLTKACFRDALLDGVNGSSCNLRQADCSGASLKGANLHAARCRGTNFQNADLRKVDFGHADLRGADLSSANLDGTRFRDAEHDGTTRVPSGFVFPVPPVKGQSPPRRPAYLEVGCRVCVSLGAFYGMEGDIKAVDEATGIVRVELTIFGRPVPVELGYDDVYLP